MILFLFAWAGAALAYVLFAGQFSPDELVAAAACGLAVSLWWLALRKQAPRVFRFEPRAGSAVFRATASLPAATAKVAARLAVAVASGRGGELAHRPFVHGREDDPADAGRRAVAVLALSLAPDSFAVRDHAGEDSLAVHAILPRAPEIDARWGR